MLTPLTLCAVIVEKIVNELFSSHKSRIWVGIYTDFIYAHKAKNILASN